MLLLRAVCKSYISDGEEKYESRASSFAGLRIAAMLFGGKIAAVIFVHRVVKSLALLPPLLRRRKEYVTHNTPHLPA